MDETETNHNMSIPVDFQDAPETLEFSENPTRGSGSQASVDYLSTDKKDDGELSLKSQKKPKSSQNLKRTSSKQDEISNLQTKMKNTTPITPAKAAKVLTEHIGALKLIAPENVGRIRSMVKSNVKVKTVDDSKNNNKSSSPAKQLTDLSAPTPKKPPTATAASIKECHLSNVLRSAQRCLDHLRDVRESLSNLVAEDDTLSKGFKVVEQSPEIARVAQIAETITLITRDAFIPAHRLNQTTIALYNAEDFLRYPSDLRTFDIATTGRIKLPDASFNATTLDKMRAVVDKATCYYNKFDGKGSHCHEIQDILFTQMRAMQDLYACTLGCQEVFKILMYTSSKEKHHLQQFLLSLPSMERSDMLTEVQDLRRLIDELVIVLEKLSWGAFVVFRLATGKTSVSSADDSQSGPFAKMETNLTLYPGYPTYVKGYAMASPRNNPSSQSPASAERKPKDSKLSTSPLAASKSKKVSAEKSNERLVVTANKSSTDGDSKVLTAKKSVRIKTKSKTNTNLPLIKMDNPGKKSDKSDASVWMQIADRLTKS